MNIIEGITINDKDHERAGFEKMVVKKVSKKITWSAATSVEQMVYIRFKEHLATNLTIVLQNGKKRD